MIKEKLKDVYYSQMVKLFTFVTHLSKRCNSKSKHVICLVVVVGDISHLVL